MGTEHDGPGYSMTHEFDAKKWLRWVDDQLENLTWEDEEKPFVVYLNQHPKIKYKLEDLMTQLPVQWLELHQDAGYLDGFIDHDDPGVHWEVCAFNNAEKEIIHYRLCINRDNKSTRVWLCAWDAQKNSFSHRDQMGLSFDIRHLFEGIQTMVQSFVVPVTTGPENADRAAQRLQAFTTMHERGGLTMYHIETYQCWIDRQIQTLCTHYPGLNTVVELQRAMHHGSNDVRIRIAQALCQVYPTLHALDQQHGILEEIALPME